MKLRWSRYLLNMSQHADKNTKMMTQTIKEWNFFFLIHRHNFLCGFDVHNGKAKPKMKSNTHYKFFGCLYTIMQQTKLTFNTFKNSTQFQSSSSAGDKMYCKKWTAWGVQHIVEHTINSERAKCITNEVK